MKTHTPEKDCYCDDLDEKYRKDHNLSAGYCGICQICGKSGHTRAHPKYPTTGCWCDEHWEDLVSGKSFGLHELLIYVSLFIFVMATIIAILIYGILKIISYFSK